MDQIVLSLKQMFLECIGDHYFFLYQLQPHENHLHVSVHVQILGHEATHAHLFVSCLTIYGKDKFLQLNLLECYIW